MVEIRRAPARHVVARFETLAFIAWLYYDDPDAWDAIADANEIRDVRTIEVGDRLVIPAEDEIYEQ